MPNTTKRKKGAKKAGSAVSKKAAKRAPKKAAAKTPPRKKASRPNPKQIVKAIENAFNEGKLDELDKYFPPDYDAASRYPLLPPGRDSVKIVHQGSMQSFPDRKTEIVDIFGEGNKVCVRMRVTGTNKGGVPFLGVPGNDAKIDFEWISIYEVKNGKVANHWGVNDVATLMVQTGAWSPPGM